MFADNAGDRHPLPAEAPLALTYVHKPQLCTQTHTHIYTHPQWLTLFFWAPKSLQMVTAAMKLKDAYSLKEKL